MKWWYQLSDRMQMAIILSGALLFVLVMLVVAT